MFNKSTCVRINDLQRLQVWLYHNGSYLRVCAALRTAHIIVHIPLNDLGKNSHCACLYDIPAHPLHISPKTKLGSPRIKGAPLHHYLAKLLFPTRSRNWKSSVPFPPSDFRPAHSTACRQSRLSFLALSSLNRSIFFCLVIRLLIFSAVSFRFGFVSVYHFIAASYFEEWNSVNSNNYLLSAKTILFWHLAICSLYAYDRSVRGRSDRLQKAKESERRR